MRSVVPLFLIVLFFSGCGIVQFEERSPQSASFSLVSFTGPYETLEPANVGIVVNDQDPDSVSIADYYRSKRGIPRQNMIHVSFAPGSAIMSEGEFTTVQAQMQPQLNDTIQVLALTWMMPYRVECMSITSAMALGFDEDAYCSTPCSTTQSVDYYNSDSARPLRDHGIRPTMALAGTSVANVMSLIDRALSAEQSFPRGKGYMLRTTDRLRSVRYPDMTNLLGNWDTADNLELEYIDNSGGGESNIVQDETDVLFYFTGLSRVAEVDSNNYVPGAVADHLTSFGGRLDGTSQMSILRWLEAGACGSYGTVVEPCNYTSKFPRISVLLDHYYRGESLIEAYWKSVSRPGEGIFVGDPLTRPWGTKVSFDQASQQLTIETTRLLPNQRYELQQAASAEGPYETVVSDIQVSTQSKKTIDFRLENEGLFFRLQEQP